MVDANPTSANTVVDEAATGDDASDTSRLIKGMRELGFKNIVQDMHSKEKSWESIGVPANLQNQLNDLAMDKPSIIQAFSIPKILAEPRENLLF